MATAVQVISADENGRVNAGPEPVTLEVILPPWKRWPYSLTTWWDVYKFGLDKVFMACMMLERIKFDCALMRPAGDRDFVPAEFPLPENKLEEIARTFAFIQRNFHDIGLVQSAMALGDSANEIGAYRQRRFTNRQVFSRIEELERVIQREMTSNPFFSAPNDTIEYYKDAGLFGPVVEGKFPRLSADISEAGKCLALGRYTACVFHLMRVMECAVQDLGIAVGVSLTHEKNWQNILDEINKAIKAMDQKNPRTKQFAETTAHLYNVKLAWRNAVMHPKDTYTLDEAKKIFENVKTFIEDLTSLI
jgi:hypothetical protein